MKLPLSIGKGNKKEYFLTLVLYNEKIIASFFEEIEGKAKVVSKSAENFKTSIEEASVEELLETADKAISTAEQSLPQSVDSVKTIFGVKASWAENNVLKKEIKEKLKKLSEELSLVPIGFLVILEAISYLLEKQEGAPISAILVEAGEKYMSAAIIKGGKLLEFKSSEITESLPATLDNLLKHFTTAEVLPTRIVVLNGKRDKIDSFKSHAWSKSLPFIDPPEVTSLPSGFDEKAMLYGAASQLGFLVLGQDKLTEDEFVSSENDSTRDINKNENFRVIPHEASLEHFGFANDRDIAKEPLPEKEDLPQTDHIPKEVDESVGEIPEEIKINEADRRQLPLNAFAILSGAKIVISQLPKIIGKFQMKKIVSPVSFLSSRGKIALLPIAAIIIFIVFGYFYYFANNATVVLNIKAKSSQKTQDITFSSDSPTDPTSGVIESEFLAVTEESSASIKSSGKKEVGTNAKGKVTIFNNNSSSQTLASGTIITASEDLEFSLDKTVTVASASGDLFSGTSPGKADVDVTAKKIGQGYNLPSNTKFSFSESSSIAAKNDEAFSGGTKKEVTVVSDADIKKLRAELPKSLENKAKENLSSKISDDQILLPDFVEITIVKEDFSADKDDEVNQITLKGTVEFKGLSYRKKDAVNFANEVLKNNISDETTIDPDSLKFKVDEIEQEKNQAYAKISINGFVIPKIDKDKIAKDISGKPFDDAKDLIKKTPQVSSTDIKLSFSLPFLPQRLPFFSNNIKISTEVHE